VNTFGKIDLVYLLIYRHNYSYSYSCCCWCSW